MHCWFYPLSQHKGATTRNASVINTRSRRIIVRIESGSGKNLKELVSGSYFNHTKSYRLLCRIYTREIAAYCVCFMERHHQNIPLHVDDKSNDKRRRGTTLFYFHNSFM